jgi:hypothetical protein
MAKVAIPILKNPPRVTLFMSGPNSVISESHWHVADNDIDTALGDAYALAEQRASLLGSDGKMVLARVSLDNVYRDSEVVDTSLMTPPSANTPCDPRMRNLRIRLEGTSLYRKTLYLGLIPDGVVTASHYDDTGLAGWDALRKVYLQLLCGQLTKPGSVWGFLVTSKDPALAPVVQIKTATVSASGSILTVVTKQAHALAANGVVRLKGCAVAAGLVPFLNGLYRVQSVVNNNSFTVACKLTAATYTLARGTAQNKFKVFQRYTDYFQRDIGYHKRGGRAFLPLGRSRTQR